MIFKAILAMDEKRGLGFQNGIPWRIKEDFQHFKKTTLGQNLIMGNTTWFNLPNRYLKDRTIWVLTRKNNYGWASVKNAQDNSIVNIIEKPEELPNTVNYWICGGRQVYELFQDKISEYMVSHIKGEHHCDVFMPEFEGKFKNVETVQTHEKFEIKRYFN